MEKNVKSLFEAIDRLEAIRSRTMLDMSAEDAADFRAALSDLENAARRVIVERIEK